MKEAQNLSSVIVKGRGKPDITYNSLMDSIYYYGSNPEGD